jgi:hypothetical protein
VRAARRGASSLCGGLTVSGEKKKKKKTKQKKKSKIFLGFWVSAVK